MKIISIIMAAVITITTLMGSMPMNSQAATNPNTSFDSNMSIEGTNSFGNLLAEKLDPEIAEQTQSIGYNVFSAEVTGTEVTVEFETMSDCTLLAGIYDETKEKLIATGTAEVLTGETEKTVNIEIEEMPQYFYLKVYLIDETTMRPMCTAYESSLYTKEMQEFLAKTVEDFDSERVLNLDEDETNNFAVYGEDVAVVESDETVNVVTAVDTENEKYVIENADSAITSLKTDDVVAIEQTSGEILIVKVGEIDIDGTTVTITGQDTNLEEVFDYIKIDVTQYSSEAFYDDSYASEGVTPVNVSKNILPDINGTNNKKAIEGEVSVPHSNNLAINVEHNNASITGSVTLNFEVKCKFYLTFSEQYVEFTIDNNHEVELAFTGSVSKEIQIARPMFAPLPCVAIVIEIDFVLEASGAVSVKGTINQIVGFSFDSELENPIKSLTTKPTFDSSINVQGTVFIGVNIIPSVFVVDENFFQAGFEVKSGVELSASMSVCEISTNYTPEMKHECEECIEGELSVNFTFGGFVTLFDCDDLTFKVEYEFPKIHIGDFYYSFDHKDFGLTTCPHQLYRLTIEVLDENDKPAGALLTINGSPNNVTNKNGICNVYFSEDESVEIKATKGRTESYRKFKMPGSAFKQRMHLRESEKTSVTTKPITTTSNKTTNKVTTTTTTPIIKANGTCGKNLTWVLYDDTLTISGNGDMYDYVGANIKAPWAEYSDYIKKVVLKDGITGIGDGAFVGCEKLISITIPDGVTSIRYSAFRACYSLTSITIPDSVTSIEEEAFSSCKNLTSITIPDGITRIGKNVFSHCSSLTSITIPDDVTSIGYGAFIGCDNLTSITIPDGVTSIGNSAFQGCKSLTSITIPDVVTSIGDHVFWGCNSLASITIPDSVTSIGDGAFGECNSLTSITIPKNVTSIGQNAFSYCNSLTSITIPDSVTSIGFGVFWDCDSLTSITIKNPKCEIYDDYYTIYNTATIYGYSGSTAQEYAKRYNREFVTIAGESQTLSLSNLKTSANLKKSAVQKSDMTEVFTDLLPNEVYNFYVMKSRTAENPLSADNLLYITQAVSDENGELTISYIPKEACDTAEIFVAGLTRKDISAAEITIPEIVFNGEEMIVTPDVVFEGETLVEGEDYNIEGGYLVTAPGEYTITIVGIGDYTNVKEVTYTVISGDNNSADTDIVYGDANCDGQVTMADAAAVFMAIGNADKYGLSEKGILNADCSGTGDGVTVSDAIAIQKLLVNLIDKLPI